MRTTYTEKRFFKWYEDDISVSLRNKSGSYGGAARCSLSTLSGNNRGLMRDGLQVGAATASGAREIDRVHDNNEQLPSRDTGRRTDKRDTRERLPSRGGVAVVVSTDNGNAEPGRASGQLQRTGRVQRPTGGE